jgi:hypothetical protein
VRERAVLSVPTHTVGSSHFNFAAYSTVVAQKDNSWVHAVKKKLSRKHLPIRVVVHTYSI